MSHAPDYRSALSFLCPLSDPESGTLLRFDGSFWPTDEPTSLTALSLLSGPAVRSLMADFPNAGRAARHHIGTAVEQLAAAVDELRGLGADEDLAASCRALSANVGNALAYREVLDTVCGAHDEEGPREDLVPVALRAFETGRAPAALTDEADTAAVVTMTDYLTAEAELRARAGAFLMAFALAAECTSERQAAVDLLGDPVTAFAREHLHHPDLYAEAVRERRTLDPQALAAAVAHRTPVPAPLPWGA